MDSLPLHEYPATSDSGVKSPSSALCRWIEGIVVILFVASIVGTGHLVFSFYEIHSQAYVVERFYIDVALAVVPLLFLAFAMAYEAKLSEGIRLAGIYKPRFSSMEQALSARENLLQIVSDQQQAAISIFDRHNRYWFVNERAVAAIGKPSSDIIGSPPVRVLDNEHAKKLEIRLAQTRTLDGPLECVERLNNHGEAQFIQYHLEHIEDTPDLRGGVVVREEDLTTLFVERERRERMLKQVIDTLVAVVDRRDPYAAGHSLRVGQLSRVIALEMELEEKLVEAAEIAGSLMNFGKVLVPRHILTKTSALSSGELQRVRDSILTSADILSIIGFEGPVVPTLRQVLERVDGTGEPDHLKGEDIMISARIVAVANAFVAFVSPRAHRGGLPFEEALAVMAHDAGKGFDERVLLALRNYIENRPNKLDWLKAGKKAAPEVDPR
ncbi:MAG: HD domain-containing phosphohydrolase [Bdellovibrionales bacterium]